MHADESQTPKPDTDLWDDPQEQSFKLDSSVEETNIESEEQKLTAEPQANSSDDRDNLVTESQTKPDFKSEEANQAIELQEEPELDFLADLEAQISTVERLEETQVESAAQRVADLQHQEQALREEIASLQASYQQLSEQMAQTQSAMGRLVQDALAHLEQRKQSLQIAVEQLERRQERIRTEMRTTFAGTSQDLAIRVQGFKDYLTGSLQDLASSVEQLELVPKAKEEPKPVVKQPQPAELAPSSTPQFAEQRFQSTTKQIRRLLDQYRNKPDYYGPPWQLRRTFEPVQAERVADWFFKQGGRGALRTMGSRLQNILLSSAIISVLYTLYDTRLRALVLANTPERLGDWRRGLQDCLGITRTDFGPDRGLVLFESPEAVAIKAERLMKANQMPLIIIDDSEDKISLSLLQFPLLLAFAPDPQMIRRDEYDF
jgi:chaperonin cofactor prefoldin